MAVSSQILNIEDLFIKNESPSGDLNCSNTHFVTANEFLPNSLEVFLDGVKKTLGVDFTIGLDNKSFDFIIDASDGNRLNKAPKPNEDLSVNYIVAC